MAKENEKTEKTEDNIIFKLFLEIAEIKHLTPEEMETYKKSLENNYYVRDIANFARMEGEQKGRMEGRKEGEQKGRMEGRMEGILKVATNLLLNGTPIEEVMFLTELSKEQMMEVLDQLPKS